MNGEHHIPKRELTHDIVPHPEASPQVVSIAAHQSTLPEPPVESDPTFEQASLPSRSKIRETGVGGGRE